MGKYRVLLTERNGDFLLEPTFSDGILIEKLSEGGYTHKCNLFNYADTMFVQECIIFHVSPHRTSMIGMQGQFVFQTQVEFS